MPQTHRPPSPFAVRFSRLLRALACVSGLVMTAAPAAAQVADMPPQLARVGVTEHLDKSLPLDTTWRDYKAADGAVGTPVTLGSLVGGTRPVLFLFAYHSCPTLCSMVLKATGRAIHDMPWTVGKDYDVEMLGSLPLDMAIRQQVDSGRPTVVADPDGRVSAIYKQIARRIAVKIGDLAQDHSMKFPSIVIQNT